MRRQHRWAMTGGAALLAVALTTACSPDPTPTPTPTGFASEEEAFAAAEATYRAYVDAMNSSLVETNGSARPEDFLTGSALDDSLAGDERLSESGVRLTGTTEVLSIRDDAWSPSSAEITVCMDHSGIRVLDASGADVTPADRPDRGALSIEVLYSAPQPLISRSTVGDLTC